LGRCSPGFQGGTFAGHRSGRSSLKHIDAGRYLSWLSLLPRRLKPMLAGRRSCAD